MNFQEAISSCEKALKLNAQDDLALTMIAYTRAFWGKYLLEHGKDPEAQLRTSIEFSQQSLLINPQLAVAYANLGLAHQFRANYELSGEKERRSNLDQALKYYRKAIDLNTTQYWNYMLAGSVSLDSAEFEFSNRRSPKEAIKTGLNFLNTATGLNPNSDLPLYYRARLNIVAAKWNLRTNHKVETTELLKAAQKDLELANQFHQNSSEIYTAFAEVYLVQFFTKMSEPELFKNGLMWSDMALKMNPNNVKALLIKAALLRKSRNNSAREASELIKKAQQINPLSHEYVFI
jgi:hypothetical protein